MKKAIASLATILFLFTNCSKPENDYDIHVDDDFLEYTMMVEFIDVANSDQTIRDLAISIEGEDADAIVEVAGEKQFEVVNGRIALGVKPSETPEEKESLRFRIKAEAPGFLPVNSEAYFRHGEKEQLTTINMIDISSPPKGVANHTTTHKLNNNLLDLNAVLDLEPTGDKQTGVEISLAAGTQFLDENGSSVFGDNLEISLTHFDADGEASLSAFPGGFMPEARLGEGKSRNEIFMNTAGFAYIEMSVNGQSVEELSQPMEIKMTLDPSTENLNTGSAVQAGDSIPVWTYDLENGFWRYRGNAAVTAQGSDLVAEFEGSKSAWYNVGYYGQKCFGTYSNGSINFELTGSKDGRGEFLLCDVVFAYNGKSISHWSTKSEYIYDGRSLMLYNAPSTACKVKVYEGSTWYNKGELIAESASFDPCSENVTVSFPADVLSEEVNIDLQVSCPSNSRFVLRANFYLYYKKPGEEHYQYLTYAYSGSAKTTKLDIGSVYDFRVYYDGQYFDFTEEVEKNSTFHVDLNSDACSTFFN